MTCRVCPHFSSAGLPTGGLLVWLLPPLLVGGLLLSRFGRAVAQPTGVSLNTDSVGYYSDALYPGGAEEAPWRSRARQRIERYRKGPLAIQVVDSAGRPVPNAQVQVRMQERTFEFGSAVTARLLNADTENGRRYRRFVRTRLNRVVFENDLKWDSWAEGASDTGDQYRHTWVRAAFDSLESWGIDVRGHYGVWGPLEGGSTPEDLTGDEIPDREQPQALREAWFENLRRRIPAVESVGRPTQWDAINHPVGWGATTVGDVLGSDFYAEVIRRMRDLAPRAEHWVNEGGVLAGNTTDSYLRVLRGLIQKGAVPDGVGVMGHLGQTEPHNLTPPDRIYERLDRLSGEIPRLQLTELDVTVDSDTLQARYFRDVLVAAFSHPDVEGILLWGFWAGRHWRPKAALYRKDWTPKPSANVFDQLLFERWWTDTAGRTNRDGRFETSGFLGSYRVRVSGPGGAAERTVRLDRDGTRVTLVLGDAP